MGIRIHQLPPAIANQIAAGEVIERPASVVKELLENSFDAGADTITIEIGYGGLNQIKISDNGIGIVAEDLPLAIAAHATSKITKLDDLYAIDSMGFRGEALASISSVAKVSISSKPPTQEHAMMLEIKGEEYSLSPCARSIGTTIDVVDLFFNAPVRKRFLKSEQLEFQAIETVVKRFALSAPHIALTLKHNNTPVLILPSAVSDQAKLMRMTKIFGRSFVKEAVFLDVECGGMRLYGWISGHNVQRSQNDRQWIYINQRMVKDKLINHALKQSYAGLLHPGRFPACLLYFSINSAEVDVNVHPTKHEVRFQQPRLVHDFFTSQLTEALKSISVANDNQDYELSSYPVLEQVMDICEPYPQINQYGGGMDPRLRGDDSTSLTDNTLVIPAQAGIQPPHESHVNLEMDPLLRMDNNRLHTSKYRNYLSETETHWVILNSRYIIMFINQQPYIADIIALQQHWLEKQLIQLELPLENRPLLVPITYSMQSKEQNKLLELQHCLSQLGVQIEFQGDKLLIRSVPIGVPYLDIRLFLDSIVELQDIQMKKLIEVLCQSQVFDPKLLSTEERIELNQLLLTSKTLRQQPYCKALTDDDCRKLLHV